MYKRALARLATSTLALIVWSGASWSQQAFIESVAKLDLTPQQNAIVSEIRKLPTTRDLQVVRVNPNVLKNSPRIMVPTTAKNFVAITNTNTQFVGDRSFTWAGNAADHVPGSSSIIVNGDLVTASIQTAEGLFRIRPIGSGLHAYFRVERTSFPQEHPPSFIQKNRDLRDIPPFQRRSEGDASIITLSVLVAYTPAVKTKVFDVKGLVDLAILEANTSYQNSGVHINLVAASPDPIEVNYKEAGSHETDLEAFRAPNDGRMDEIHALRDKLRAHIGVLLIDDGSYCGLASQILATKETAFAVVYHDCATGYYSFAHEIGHLQGARHNPETDDTKNPFAYGHGFMDVARKRRTIMSYDCPAGCPRMPQWARPPEWGTADLSHDARVLNETAPYVSGFR